MKDETLLHEKMTADYAWGNLGVSAEDCSAWADGWNARAALQSGNSAQPVTVPDGWIPVSERMPEPESERRVCVYTPTPHEDMRYRFVAASLFKVVCRDATHWHYMTPPDAPKVTP